MIQHLSSFRNAIEPAAAAEAARTATPEQLSLMKAALDVMCVPLTPISMPGPQCRSC